MPSVWLHLVLVSTSTLLVEAEGGLRGVVSTLEEEEEDDDLNCKILFSLLCVSILLLLPYFLYSGVIYTVHRLEEYLDRVSFQRELKQAENSILQHVGESICSELPSEDDFDKKDRVASLNLVVYYYGYRRGWSEESPTSCCCRRAPSQDGHAYSLSPMEDCFSSLTMTLRPHLAPTVFTVEGRGTWKDGPCQIVKGMFCSTTGEIFWVEKPTEGDGLQELLFTGRIRHFGIGGMWVLDRLYWKALQGGQGHAVSSYDPSHPLNLGFAEFFQRMVSKDDDTAECLSEGSESDEEEMAVAETTTNAAQQEETEEEGHWEELVVRAQQHVLGDHVEACALSNVDSNPHHEHDDLETESSMEVCFTSVLESTPSTESTTNAGKEEEALPFQIENAQVMNCTTRHWVCEDCPKQGEYFLFYVIGNNCTKGILTPDGKAYWVQEWNVISQDRILVVGSFVFQKQEGRWEFEGSWTSQSGGHGVVSTAGDLGLLSSLLEIPLLDEEL